MVAIVTGRKAHDPRPDASPSATTVADAAADRDAVAALEAVLVLGLPTMQHLVATSLEGDTSVHLSAPQMRLVRELVGRRSTDIGQPHRAVDADRWPIAALSAGATGRTTPPSGAPTSLADNRDQAGVRRDRQADERDAVSERRDHTAMRRDHLAEHRDYLADQVEGRPSTRLSDEVRQRLARTRLASAADRRQAAEDRQAGANERVHAQQDRDTAHADRGASALERAAASVDGLTGVYLRGPGLVELQREVARAGRTSQSLVLAFLDVDHLKARNDADGHAAGDRLLVAVANTLRSVLRPYDLVVRYGGDEFLCALPGLLTAQAAERLAQVNAALAAGHHHAEVTVGLADLHPGDSLDDLIGRADAALYRLRRVRRKH